MSLSVRIGVWGGGGGGGGTLSHFLLFDLYMEIERGPHKNNCAILYYTP